MSGPGRPPPYPNAVPIRRMEERSLLEREKRQFGVDRSCRRPRFKVGVQPVPKEDSTRKWATDIGLALIKMEYYQFRPKSKHLHAAKNGEAIVQNVKEFFDKFKEKLGSLAYDTIFNVPTTLAATVCGISEGTLRARLKCYTADSWANCTDQIGSSSDTSNIQIDGEALKQDTEKMVDLGRKTVDVASMIRSEPKCDDKFYNRLSYPDKINFMLYNIKNGIQAIKDEYGNVSEDSPFYDTFKLASFLTGISEKTIRQAKYIYTAPPSMTKGKKRKKTDSPKSDDDSLTDEEMHESASNLDKTNDNNDSPATQSPSNELIEEESIERNIQEVLKNDETKKNVEDCPTSSSKTIDIDEDVKPEMRLIDLISINNPFAPSSSNELATKNSTNSLDIDEKPANCELDETLPISETLVKEELQETDMDCVPKVEIEDSNCSIIRYAEKVPQKPEKLADNIRNGKRIVKVKKIVANTNMLVKKLSSDAPNLINAQPVSQSSNSNTPLDRRRTNSYGPVDKKALNEANDQYKNQKPGASQRATDSHGDVKVPAFVKVHYYGDTKVLPVSSLEPTEKEWLQKNPFGTIFRSVRQKPPGEIYDPSMEELLDTKQMNDAQTQCTILKEDLLLTYVMRVMDLKMFKRENQKKINRLNTEREHQIVVNVIDFFRTLRHKLGTNAVGTIFDNYIEISSCASGVTRVAISRYAKKDLLSS